MNPNGPPAVSYTFPNDVSASAGAMGAKLRGVGFDSAGNAYIADTARHVVIKITPAGLASTFAGAPERSGTTDGTGVAARFDQPEQLVLDKANNVYVLDRGNYTVRKITPAGVVSTLVGVAGVNTTKVGDLPGGLANPAALAIDDNACLYVTVDQGVVRIKLP